MVVTSNVVGTTTQMQPSFTLLSFNLFIFFFLLQRGVKVVFVFKRKHQSTIGTKKTHTVPFQRNIIYFYELK